MRRFKNRGEATLYLWDYFYLANAPRPGEERVWRIIENAACRIRELEPFLRPSASRDEQLRNARRLRRAVRVIVDQLPRLKAEVAPWISDVLRSLDAEVSAIIAAPQQDVPGPVSDQDRHTDRGLSN
jgi:hypothetical protein